MNTIQLTSALLVTRLVLLVIAGFTLTSAQNVVYAQSLPNDIDYGSNNGKTIEVNGTKLYYEEYGQGTPLILLHGGLSSIRGLRSIIPALSKSFHVYAVDAPGNGRSEQADSISYPLMADYYSRMIDLLQLDSVYVYGFSLGGTTALHLAANRQDKVKMLIAHSASNHLDGYNEQFAGTPEMTPEVVEEYAQWWLEGHLKRTPEPDKWKKFIHDMQKVWYPREFISDSSLQSIKASTLIVQGDKDLIWINTAHHIHTQIKNSQLAILPNTTHFVHGEDPELLLDIIVPFLTKKTKQTFEWVY